MIIIMITVMIMMKSKEKSLFPILIVTAWLDPKISLKFTTTCHSFPHLSQQHVEIPITLFYTLAFFHAYMIE